MVNIVVAPDKFKGSLTAKEVCQAVADALTDARIQHTLAMIPMADGGEGTSEILTTFFKGTKITVAVSDPLNNSVDASYGISGDGTTAFIEMAQASGLQLLAPEKRNPLLTSTVGTGELIRDAILRGVKNIVLGIGGSATNDAGIGMAAALGFAFLDKQGNSLTPVGQNLIHLHEIRSTNVLPALQQVSVVVLCDVTNPLHGKNGAAHVYGPQKGASEEAVITLDLGLRNFERIAFETFSMAANFPGAGAAGGLGAGAKLFLNATLCSGIDYLVRAMDVDKKIANANVVITGEGKLDPQSLSGKVVFEITTLARRFNKPVIVICGRNELPEHIIAEHGIKAVISLVTDETPESEAMYNASGLLRKRLTQFFLHQHFL
jgi:glycerate 2-kinase